MEAGGFLKSQVDTCVWYREEMVLLFYVEDCLIFSTSKNKIDDVYTSLQAYLKTKHNGDIYEYLGIYPDCRPYG